MPDKPNTRQVMGRYGESVALDWYLKHDYILIQRNWRTRRGEVDLIVSNPTTLVFCEVKTRNSTKFGTGFDAITAQKQQRYRILAEEYLSLNPTNKIIRFDAVAIFVTQTGDQLGTTFQIIQGAFDD